jgi:ATP-binding cassette, subfamily B, multidrug efflux pump
MMAHGPMGGRPGGAFRGPAGSPKTTRHPGQTLRQLVGRLRPEASRITLAAVLASTGIAFTVIAPRIIGNATDVIFNGVVGEGLPAGMTQAQVIAGLRLHGQGQLAQMLSGMNVTPGRGIDFAGLGVILGVVALLYLLGAAFSWMQGYLMAGVAQRTVFAMRRDVEAKLRRLPCSTSTAIRTVTC